MKSPGEKSLTKNISRVLVSNFWAALLGFVGSFIFPKILTIESYALYHTFTLYIGYIAICHLGFPSGMVINYAGKDYESLNVPHYKSEVKIITIVLLLFTAIFGIVSIFTHNRMMFYVMLAVLPTGLTGSYKALYQSWNQFKKFSWMNTIIATSIPCLALLYYIVFKDLPGDVYIVIYLIVYWCLTIYILSEIIKKTRGVKADGIFSKANLATEKVGIAFTIGNYINTLFVSVDKQFVSWFFNDSAFAYYSFGMSLQALMTVFITSLAQPMFPAMAKENFQDEEYRKLKHSLMIFGSFSGCAYFAASIIVKLFIKKYIPSLSVVGIYFSVFPAMAVINCLYINLYKIKGMMKLYIKTLFAILIVAIVLNSIFILIMGKFIGVAIATTITYYLWLIIGSRQFEILSMTFREYLYLGVFLIGFFVITSISNDWIGILIYALFVVTTGLIFFKQDILYFFNKVRR